MGHSSPFLALVVLLGISVCVGRPRGRILGGYEAPRHLKPYMASLQVDQKHVCGGFLIAEQWVLSAAHCLEDNPGNKPFQVLLGVHSLSQPEPHKRLYGVRTQIRHPGSSEETYDDDLLLLQLEEKALLNEHVKVLPFQRQDSDVPADTLCEVAGWGKMTHSGALPDKLQQVALPVISRKECNQRNRHDNSITEKMMCTNSRKLDTCLGDSGGPLVCNGIAEGVVAGGSRVCGNYKRPGIYTRIAPYVDWIESVMLEIALSLEAEGFVSPSPFGLSSILWPVDCVRHSIISPPALASPLSTVLLSVALWFPFCRESIFMLIQAIRGSLQKHRSPGLLFQPSHAPRTLEMKIIRIALLKLLLLCSTHAGKQDATIIGGHKVKNHSRPYMGFLENEYREVLCDGFLIQPEWVMTAAHCNDSRNTRILLVLGTELVSNRSNRRWGIAKFHSHPDYDRTTLENDIMLLQLNSAVTYDEAIQPVKLPPEDREIPGTAACSTAGWGRTTEGGKPSESLWEVNVTLVSRDSCQSFYKEKNITMNMICAGNEKHNACEGDSGGPLVCDGVAEGVVSFGSKKCGKSPTVYTKIARYVPWINGIIKSAS
ncbi:complement factor D [Emydura macquarii macquarii]|uniref:complement factor D n=1 Tax=Emydura macquarii macquarii TaxID=1129001 RepID=UPI00352A6076